MKNVSYKGIIRHHITSFSIIHYMMPKSSYNIIYTTYDFICLNLLYDAIWYTSSVCICMRHVLNEVVFILMISIFDIPKWVWMIHVSKWVLMYMYCRLCAPPHTQSECCKNCILCTRLLNDVIWYGHKWCHMSFIWDMCMTSVWCDRCMQFEWYGSPVWRHMIQSCMIINDTKWFTYATGVVSSRSPTRVV